MTQHPAAPRPTQTDDPRPAVVTLVGNPRPGSRTLTAARTVAARVADHLGLAPADPTPATIDLAEIATEILAPEQGRRPRS